MSGYIVCDMQGFMVNNNFEPKELSICVDLFNTYTYLIKPMIPFMNLSKEDKVTTRYLEDCHHCIHYSNGFVNAYEVYNIFKKFINYTKTKYIYVKGSQKFEYVRSLKIPNVEVIDLGNDSSVITLEPCHNHCFHHTHAFSACSNVNVIKLYNYILSFNK